MVGLKEPTRKRDRVLEIYSRLLSGEIIRKQNLADEYGVNPRSIQRDIDAIRDFYANRMDRHGELTEVQYDRIAKRRLPPCYSGGIWRNGSEFLVKGSR